MGNLNSLRPDTEQDNEHRVTVMNYHNGDRYEGEIFKNLRDGQGCYICGDKEKRSNYEYTGLWKNNLRDGYGKCFFYNGDLYVGDWKQGKRHGKGDHFYRKGERYQGEWKNDMKDGEGNLVSSNGSKFKGKFKQDKKHGVGEMILPDGQVFEETWQFGILASHRKIEAGTTDQPSTKTSQSNEKNTRSQTGRSSHSGTSSQAQKDKQAQEKLRQMSKAAAAAVPPSLEKVDIIGNIYSLLMKKSDILQWTNDDVIVWLQACTLDQFIPCFKKLNIDGYTLIQVKEHDLEVHFKIDSLGYRKNIIKNIYITKGLWVKLTGDAAHGLNMSENPSIIEQSWDGDQTSLTHRSSVLDSERNHTVKPSPSNKEVPSKRRQARQFPELSMLSGGSTSRMMSRFQNTSQNLSNDNSNGLIKGIGNEETEMEREDDDQEHNDDYQEEAGLIKSFKSSGFNFFIDFTELTFDTKNDYIGGGGYGDVYVGKWLGTKVAVKRFGKRYLTRKAVKDFIKEIEVVNQLRHPNIVLYMGVSLDQNNFYYMITEFVSKGSLFELLHQKKLLLDDNRIIKVAKQIAMSLQYLHKKKILHCDLKSQNILLNDDWTVKICDFGLARYKEKFQKDNHGKIGTPHWMAPEILRGEKYEEAADVYSFGVILWEMLTGEIPYMGRSISQITGIVGYHKERLQFRERANKNLKKIVNNCLLFEPNRRPSFDHILNYIERIERKPKYETTTPIIVKLGDFLS